MFIYYFVLIDRPRQAVEDAVLDRLGGLGEFAKEAYREGERMRIGPAPHALTKKVELKVIAPPHHWPQETWIPISWRASGIPSLFPRMEADIVIAAVGSDLTQLALRGSYVTPLAGLGRVIDGVLLHRLAEATVKMFVERLAGSVRRDLDDLDPIPIRKGPSDPISVAGSKG